MLWSVLCFRFLDVFLFGKLPFESKCYFWKNTNRIMIIMMMANIVVWFSVKLSWLFSLTLSEHIKMYWNCSKTNIIQHYTRNNKYPSNHDVDAATDPNILSFPLPPSASMFHSEKDSLEKLLSGLQQEVDSQHAELEALRASLLELQRQRDLLRQQREDLETQLARQRTEAQRGYSKSEGEWPLHNTHIPSPLIVLEQVV